MRNTQKHAEFFALMVKENIARPQVIKWERGITDLVTQDKKPEPKPFGVSIAEAFKKGGIK